MKNAINPGTITAEPEGFFFQINLAKFLKSSNSQKQNFNQNIKLQIQE